MMTEDTLELDNFFVTIQNPYPVYAFLREHSQAFAQSQIDG